MDHGASLGARGRSVDQRDGVVPVAVSVFDDRVPAVGRLQPGLLGALRRAAVDAERDGVRLRVNSGWRSPAYQRRLWRDAIVKYGSREEAARWVATPETSAHVTGEAVDIGPRKAAAWLRMTRRIVVIGGGENAEHDVSLATAAAVAEALRSGGFDVEEVTIGRDGTWRRGEEVLGSGAIGSVAGALGVIERADAVLICPSAAPSRSTPSPSMGRACCKWTTPARMSRPSWSPPSPNPSNGERAAPAPTSTPALALDWPSCRASSAHTMGAFTSPPAPAAASRSRSGCPPHRERRP
nr:D-alanyl-D-alanine carboxypeptidase family protein [Actinomadura sp. NBRC 104412]